MTTPQCLRHDTPACEHRETRRARYTVVTTGRAPILTLASGHGDRTPDQRRAGDAAARLCDDRRPLCQLLHTTVQRSAVLRRLRRAPGQAPLLPAGRRNGGFPAVVR